MTLDRGPQLLFESCDLVGKFPYAEILISGRRLQANAIRLAALPNGSLCLSSFDKLLGHTCKFCFELRDDLPRIDQYLAHRSALGLHASMLDFSSGQPPQEILSGSSGAFRIDRKSLSKFCACLF